MKGKAQWSLLDEISLKKFQFHCFFSFLLALFFSQICSVEHLKAFLLFLIFFFFLLCGILSFFFYLLSNVEAVSIFLVLFLTPSCDQQYLPLNPFLYLLSFSYFLHLPFPLPPPYLFLTLAGPGMLWLS